MGRIAPCRSGVTRAEMSGAEAGEKQGGEEQEVCVRGYTCQSGLDDLLLQGGRGRPL